MYLFNSIRSEQLRAHKDVQVMGWVWEGEQGGGVAQGGGRETWGVQEQILSSRRPTSSRLLWEPLWSCFSCRLAPDGPCEHDTTVATIKKAFLDHIKQTRSSIN